MKPGHELAELMKLLARDERREDFQDSPYEHFGAAGEAAHSLIKLCKAQRGFPAGLLVEDRS